MLYQHCPSMHCRVGLYIYTCTLNNSLFLTFTLALTIPIVHVVYPKTHVSCRHSHLPQHAYLIPTIQVSNSFVG